MERVGLDPLRNCPSSSPVQAVALRGVGRGSSTVEAGLRSMIP